MRALFHSTTQEILQNSLPSVKSQKTRILFRFNNGRLTKALIVFQKKAVVRSGYNGRSLQWAGIADKSRANELTRPCVVSLDLQTFPLLSQWERY